MVSSSPPLQPSGSVPGSLGPRAKPRARARPRLACARPAVRWSSAPAAARFSPPPSSLCFTSAAEPPTTIQYNAGRYPLLAARRRQEAVSLLPSPPVPSTWFRAHSTGFVVVVVVVVVVYVCVCFFLFRPSCPGHPPNYFPHPLVLTTTSHLHSSISRAFWRQMVPRGREGGIEEEKDVVALP